MLDISDVLRAEFGYRKHQLRVRHDEEGARSCLVTIEDPESLFDRGWHRSTTPMNWLLVDAVILTPVRSDSKFIALSTSSYVLYEKIKATIVSRDRYGSGAPSRVSATALTNSIALWAAEGWRRFVDSLDEPDSVSALQPLQLALLMCGPDRATDIPEITCFTNGSLCGDCSQTKSAGPETGP
jgi:hypothetical protein